MPHEAVGAAARVAARREAMGGATRGTRHPRERMLAPAAGGPLGARSRAAASMEIRHTSRIRCDLSFEK